MAEVTYNIDEIQAELIKFKNTSGPKEIFNSAIMSKNIHVNSMATTVQKIQGKFHNIQALMGHVVQAFSPKWEAMGNIQFRKKQLRNFHQKVNLEILPAEIISSWLESMYDEGKDLKDKSISRHTVNMLGEKLISDVNYLSVDGQYDEAGIAATPQVFGSSMDGLNTITSKMLANTENPCFRIPIDAITDNNIVDMVTEFERALPSAMKPLLKEVRMSENNKERYSLNYEDTHGRNNDFNSEKGVKTRLGKRSIKGIPGFRDDLFYATIDRNFFRLIDRIENPARITDVQKFDYTLKIFGEFSLGYDFGINEVVVVADASSGAIRGLGDATLNKLYYPNEF